MTVHVKFVPDTALDRAKPVVPPLQIDSEEGVAIATGTGFTVISAVNVLPEHPFAVGVTIYDAVPWTGALVESV